MEEKVLYPKAEYTASRDKALIRQNHATKSPHFREKRRLDLAQRDLVLVSIQPWNGCKDFRRSQIPLRSFHHTQNICDYPISLTINTPKKKKKKIYYRQALMSLV